LGCHADVICRRSWFAAKTESAVGPLQAAVGKRRRVDALQVGAIMVLLFMHIPKTGGLALADWVSPAFGSDAPWEDKFFRGGIYYYPSGYVDCVPGQTPAHMQRIFRDPSLRAVVGHFRYGIHTDIPQPTAYVTILREPVDRIVSLYSFHR